MYKSVLNQQEQHWVIQFTKTSKTKKALTFYRDAFFTFSIVLLNIILTYKMLHVCAVFVQFNFQNAKPLPPQK